MSDAPRDPTWWRASDGKWYPPHPPHPPPKQRSGCLRTGLIVLAVLVVLGIGFVACAGLVLEEAGREMERQMGEADDGDYDLELTSCGVDELAGWPEAGGRIVNTSDEDQGFEIRVRFTAPDGDLIGESSTFTDRIEVGQATMWSTAGIEHQVDGEVQCTVRRVNYHIFDS